MAARSRTMFKLVFVKKCQAEGLDDNQILARIEKMAEWVKTAHLGDVVNAIGEFANRSPSHFKAVTGLLVTAPFATGAATGMLGSKLKGNFLDEEDVKKQEIADELKRQTTLAQQYKRMGGLAPAK